jgi:N-ethylmaleimide reductase
MLFQPVTVGDIALRNRIVMAPMTRSRADDELAPTPLNVEYYAQRASAGMIITEATQISAQAQGYKGTPGLYTEGQVRGWKAITEAVHDRGGKIVVQLWHTGRMSHSSFQPGGLPPVAPSAIRAKAQVFIAEQGFVDASVPRALPLKEIPLVIDDFRATCRRAMEAGFDGVEIHGAHGYLLDSFLRDSSNHRTDAYGGPIENRARLLIETAEACAREIGKGRLGVRIAPVSPAGDSHDSDPQPLFEHVVERLDDLGIAFIDVVEGATGGARDYAPFDYAALRRRFHGAWILNNGYDRDIAARALENGDGHLVAFGRLFVANPDLVRRLRQNGPYNVLNTETTYRSGPQGYTDYPALS